MERSMNARPTPWLSALFPAAAHSAAVILVGWLLLGPLPSLLFSFGFLTGLISWLAVGGSSSFQSIRSPYWATLGLFIVHKTEERLSGFFPALAKLTGIPVSEELNALGIILYALSAAWLLIPFLMNRGIAFGQYLAWTFFCSMGITELAHFIFPLFTNTPYAYFPGMVSVLGLAPAAWWGMWSLRQEERGSKAPPANKYSEGKTTHPG